MRFNEPRRVAPRIEVDGICGVVSQHEMRHAMMMDLSSLGVRLEREFDATKASRDLQLELELPELGETVWARGTVTYAHLSPLGGKHANGQPKLWCSAGVKIDRIVGREFRMLRDYVMETRRAKLAAESMIEMIDPLAS